MQLNRVHIEISFVSVTPHCNYSKTEGKNKKDFLMKLWELFKTKNEGVTMITRKEEIMHRVQQLF